MSVHYADDWLTVLHGDAITEIATLPAESVHCVVTSPPYWGLRDYGTATWVGGTDGCDHLIGPPASSKNTLNGGGGWTPTEYGMPFKGNCGKCGARRVDSQLGLEPTPEAYVANLVAVFREVRRVLRADGTVWLNLGDSYAGGATTGETRPGAGRADGIVDQRAQRNRNGIGSVTGLKPKDLVGIPWRVAFALQADGWYLRSDIIWSKPNPMPESVTDRPTKSHEYLFLLSKSARYYFDADAVREGFADERMGNPGRYKWGYGQATGKGSGDSSLLGSDGIVKGWNEDGTAAGRNIRSVWTVAAQPYPGAHFATFPPKLIEPCIKAGCPEGGVVLDMFAGSGTTGLVAQRLGRRAVLIDLSMDYLGQLMARNAQKPLGLGA